MAAQGDQAEMRFDQSNDPLAGVYGQAHIVKQGSTFRKVVGDGLVDSILIVGPPGSGKSHILKEVERFLCPWNRHLGPVGVCS